MDRPDTASTGSSQPAAADDETPTRRLDRLAQTSLSALFGNLSPITMALAAADWGWHLAAAPGRRLELAALSAQLALDTALMRESEGANGADDPRLAAPEWDQWPFSQWRLAHRNAHAFWREAAQVPGVDRHHADMVGFFARQWLDMLSPANQLATNPVVLKETLSSGGANLARGAANWVADATGRPTAGDSANGQRFVVGGNLAVTPGKVIHRNHLVELIRYAPQTDKVHPEPVFIVPSWIMKYYILDLSPHNSLVRYLVGQGHTVYMLSWRNPDTSDRDLSMDDYLNLGVLESMQVARKDAGGKPLHAMGYCLGGTLLAIAVAALSRPQGVPDYPDLPAPHTLSLLAALVDFSEPGELGLLIDEGQVNLLSQIMEKQGVLTGKQMAGSFQFLRARDLVWTRQMREYLLGERFQPNDLMAWNADTTRMPARMHREYLVSLYLHNALANGQYRVGDAAVSLGDLRMPVFLVGTERDHVSPWPSVYNLHHLSSTEITFALSSGGHNGGIVSPPDHPRRRHRLATRAVGDPWISPEDWMQQNEVRQGSWWPSWQAWLAEHSSKPVKAKRIPARRALCDAPGTYVLQRYKE